MTLIEILGSLEIGLIYGIVAIGVYFTFRVIDFPDLTCDGSFVTGAAVSAIALKSGYSPWIAIGLALAAGNVAGFFTGLIHIYGKVSTLLAGILMAFMLYSINLRIMGGLPNLTLIQEETIFRDSFPLNTLLMITFFIGLICWVILKSDFGLALRSIGQNQRLAFINGVPLSRMTIVALMGSNGLIGVGGALFSQHQGFADISQGMGSIIMALAAVMIGEKILPFRSVGMILFSCLAGSVLYRFLIAFALHGDGIGLQTSDLNLITGLLIIGIMQIPQLKRRRILC